MLMALNTPLEDGGESSKRRCWDFTGQKYIPMAKEGYVWMCFTNPAVSGDNSTEIADGFHMLKVYTQTAAQITDNILSVSRMVKLLGFELKFRPTGWEGFKRKDPNTGRIVKIPVFYDDADMLWYIYFTRCTGTSTRTLPPTACPSCNSQGATPNGSLHSSHAAITTTRHHSYNTRSQPNLLSASHPPESSDTMNKG